MQGSNPGFFRQVLYSLSHQGKPLVWFRSLRRAQRGSMLLFPCVSVMWRPSKKGAACQLGSKGSPEPDCWHLTILSLQNSEKQMPDSQSAQSMVFCYGAQAKTSPLYCSQDSIFKPLGSSVVQFQVLGYLCTWEPPACHAQWYCLLFSSHASRVFP